MHIYIYVRQICCLFAGYCAQSGQNIANSNFAPVISLVDKKKRRKKVHFGLHPLPPPRTRFLLEQMQLDATK